MDELSGYSEATWCVLQRQNILDDCMITLQRMPDLADYDFCFDPWRVLNIRCEWTGWVGNEQIC